MAIGLAVGLASALKMPSRPPIAYIPLMIREDRVWEYLWIRVESKRPISLQTAELFPYGGSTAPRKKAVRSYHRFVYCGDRVKWGDHR